MPQANNQNGWALAQNLRNLLYQSYPLTLYHNHTTHIIPILLTIYLTSKKDPIPMSLRKTIKMM